jgi:hypothetical protein
VVNPVVHDPSTHESQNETRRRDARYFKNGKTHQAEYIREVNVQEKGKMALKGISEGHVVRHTGDESIVLLHNDRISPGEADHRHQNNQVFDLYHQSHGAHLLDYKAATSLWNQQRKGKEMPLLNQRDRDHMLETLVTYQKNAKMYGEKIKMEEKVFWKPKVEAKEPLPPKWAARLDAVEKRLKESSSDRSAPIASRPSSSGDKST